LTYIIDNESGQLSDLSLLKETTYIRGADELFNLLNDVIVPEAVRRKKSITDKYEAANDIDLIRKEMSVEKQINIFIHNFGELLNIVYIDPRQMNSFLENVTKKGAGYKISFFAVITREASTALRMQQLYTNFTAWKEGIHLGGNSANQRVLDFELPASEQIAKLPAGTGHTLIDGKSVQIIMPVV
jgi:S-DNA-T family DNA segregation ATPase FtsK/SpoIIIE